MRTLSLRNVSIEILLLLRNYRWQKKNQLLELFDIYNDTIIIIEISVETLRNDKVRIL